MHSMKRQLHWFLCSLLHEVYAKIWVIWEHKTKTYTYVFCCKPTESVIACTKNILILLHGGVFYCHHLLDRGITVREKFTEIPAPGSWGSQRSKLCEELVTLAFSHQGLRLLLLGTRTLTFPTTGTPVVQSLERCVCCVTLIFYSLCMSKNQVWQCGGSVEVLPCARIAHIERAHKPYTEDLTSHVRRNALRVAEVWMDEFKSHVYMAWNIPMEVS